MKSNSKKIGVTLLRKNFWSMLKVYNSELAKEYRTRKRQNDYCYDIRCMWADYVDSQAKAGVISESVANRATL